MDSPTVRSGGDPVSHPAQPGVSDVGSIGQGHTNLAMAAVLVDEWVRAGVRVAALSPGSRSTPLALALAATPRIRLEVFLDERCAAFFALGAAKASGVAAVVVCTSGTAAAHFHPAVAEARHGLVPLLAVTADRPAELRGCGAPQTIDQVGLFGDAVRWQVDLPAPSPAAGADPVAVRWWRSVACRALAEAMGPPAGPVHVNVGFREPLVTSEAVDAPGGRSDGRPWVLSPRPRAPTSAADVLRLAEAVRTTERGLVVAGWGAGDDTKMFVHDFAHRAGWPVLADPLSGLRQPGLTVSTYDALLRAPGFGDSHRPDLVLSLGAPTTSAALTSWLDDRTERMIVDPHGSWLDPMRSAGQRLVADPGTLLAGVLDTLGGSEPGADRTSSGWCQSWMTAEARARSALDSSIDREPYLTEPGLARDLVAALPNGSTLVIGSSMPVRDIDSFARPRHGVRFLANRGANGIDGFWSTLLGVAATSEVDVVGFCGDLTFLHDANGMLGAGARGLRATLVVVDNDGGGIFSFLPQANAVGDFTKLFATPHGLDLADLVRAHGLGVRSIVDTRDLAGALAWSATKGGVNVLVASTNRRSNVDFHRALWDGVRDSTGN
ncbi:MAG: 2-succinyl-5-enolpyruvyl-6-hydroxy-3-cyclohexene-1-carboxylic-acid synthase [Acidimicrobiales bacterium]